MGPDFLVGRGEEAYKEYQDFLLWHYTVVDAFWFIRVEEEYGLAAAEELNARVWGKAAQLAARQIRKRFGIPEHGGLDAFETALAYFPWAVIVGYQPRREDGALVIEVAHCPSQEGRKRNGKGEYACKAMHMAEFSAFAREIDPAIVVTCEHAPPDPHPAERYCRWRFTVAQGPTGPSTKGADE
ncbi:MAG: hypothetical protein H0S85_16165 [Desulfovibrionaceae bacterium]|jgi:hypothetical protein|nr:hypothetical protein [Desulfovibrionaceae bacterium]